MNKAFLSTIGSILVICSLFFGAFVLFENPSQIAIKENFAQNSNANIESETINLGSIKDPDPCPLADSKAVFDSVANTSNQTALFATQIQWPACGSAPNNGSKVVCAGFPNEATVTEGSRAVSCFYPTCGRNSDSVITNYTGIDIIHPDKKCKDSCGKPFCVHAVTAYIKSESQNRVTPLGPSEHFKCQWDTSVSDSELPSSCDNLKGNGGVKIKTLQDYQKNCSWLINSGPNRTCTGPGGGVFSCTAQTNAGTGCANEDTTPPEPSSQCLNDLANYLQETGKCWTT